MNPAIKHQRSDVRQNQEQLWQAVVEKDRKFDGLFVFAVRTTGIYCRPSCPARRPRRERVEFFSLPELAEQAGFRACLRCHPSQATNPDPQLEMVRKACRFIQEHTDEPSSLDILSERLGLSPFHLQRTFKSIMGITPRQYAESCRTDRFKMSIRAGESVTAAMYEAGYGSSSRLYERAAAELGMTPGTYGKAGRQTTITYTVVHSPLGHLLVAATDKGICNVRLGDSADTLEAELLKEFSAADIRKGDSDLREHVNQILEHLAGKQPRLDLPLDIQATAFQRQVWEALRGIPYGRTQSYSDIARQIGQPKAVRAVARACATNPVALVIPCHRVIREDKSLGGYRWGLERKRKLLRNESSSSDKNAAVPGKLPF